MKLRNWITSSSEKQAKEPVEVGGLELDADGEVLKSGHALEEFQEDIEEREEYIDELQRGIRRHEKKKKRAVEKAKKADTESEKQKHMVEAKEHKVLKEKKSKILDHLREEILQLKKLRLQHLQDNIGSDGELDIDLSELPVNDIEDAIEENSDELWESRENMEDLDDAMQFADNELGGLDLSDIEEEVDGTTSRDNVDLSDRSLETEEEIDQAIEEELEKIEEMQSDGR
jgi:hypothetical protein